MFLLQEEKWWKKNRKISRENCVLADFYSIHPIFFLIKSKPPFVVQTQGFHMILLQCAYVIQSLNKCIVRAVRAPSNCFPLRLLVMICEATLYVHLLSEFSRFFVTTDAFFLIEVKVKAKTNSLQSPLQLNDKNMYQLNAIPDWSSKSNGVHLIPSYKNAP